MLASAANSGWTIEASEVVSGGGALLPGGSDSAVALNGCKKSTHKIDAAKTRRMSDPFRDDVEKVTPTCCIDEL